MEANYEKAGDLMMIARLGLFKKSPPMEVG
jgi:hypothetical protein